MSDGPLGEGWWRAVDGKWYPPERHPDYVAKNAPPPPDESPGHGWWKAADGQWYPPERHPDYRPPSPAPPTSVRMGPPPPPPGPPPGYSISGSGVVTKSQTTESGYNRLAIGSLIAGVFGCLCVGAPVAIVLGHMGLSQISKSGGEQGGKPMAIMGLLLGYGFAAYYVIGTLWAAFFSSPSS